MRPHTVIIGGSRGLGRALAETAINAGQRVSVVARSFGPSAAEGQYPCDITDPHRVAITIEQIHRERGPFNGMVFVQRFRGSGDDWGGEIATTLTATRIIVEQSAERFTADGSRSIVLVSSTAAQFISSTVPCSYHVAKAGLCQMARYFASRLGPRGIRVNAICPGTFIKPESQVFYEQNPLLAGRLASASPLNRMGTWNDVAEAILFLLSDKSSFITGQSLIVDGGVSLRSREE